MKKKKKFDDWKTINDQQFQAKINKYQNSIIIPELKNNDKVNFCNIDSINIKKIIPKNKIINTNLNIVFDKLYKNNNDLTDKLKKTIIYEIKPTIEQKNILLFWFDIYITMYNKILEKVKKIRKNENIIQKKNVKLNELNLNLDLATIKKEFIEFKETLANIKNPITKKINNINKHILDYAIKDAITSIKSIISNLNNNHIKNTRLRYIKKDKNKKIIKIEKNICQTNSFCSSVLGKNLTIIPALKFNEIKEVATLQYDKKKDKFYFLVKEKVKQKEKNKNKDKKIIALDPGFRTLLTGISNDHVIEIGIDPLNPVKKIIKKIEKIREIKIKNKRRQLKRREERLNNYINDMHNKITKKIVSDYDEILIGNMSTKSIVENETTNKENKKKANNLKIYKLREKIKNKCIKENKSYKLVNEYNTSKKCSNCGKIKKDLGGNKEYKCEGCKKEYDRDVNACKNILIKSIK